jgi:hypothetical protein
MPQPKGTRADSGFKFTDVVAPLRECGNVSETARPEVNLKLNQVHANDTGTRLLLHLAVTFFIMNVPLLPQELIDNITNRVPSSWLSYESLLALVSKVFRPRVQRLLFHHVTLNEERPARTERLSNMLACNPRLASTCRWSPLLVAGSRRSLIQ